MYLMIFYIFLLSEIPPRTVPSDFLDFIKKKLGDLTQKNPEPLIFLTLKPSYFRTYLVYMVGGQSPSETEKKAACF